MPVPLQSLSSALQLRSTVCCPAFFHRRSTYFFPLPFTTCVCAFLFFFFANAHSDLFTYFGLALLCKRQTNNIKLKVNKDVVNSMGRCSFACFGATVGVPFLCSLYVHCRKGYCTEQMVFRSKRKLLLYSYIHIYLILYQT